MVLKLAEWQGPRDSNEMVAYALSGDWEVVAFCPGCKTMETLSFNSDQLIQTRKFRQTGIQVFHECGAQSRAIYIAATVSHATQLQPKLAG